MPRRVQTALLMIVPAMAIASLALAAIEAPGRVLADGHGQGEHGLTFAVSSDGKSYRVNVDFYLDDSATEADIEAATAAISARFKGAVPQSESSVAQFVTSGPHWPGNMLTWHYNPAGEPDSLGGGMTGLSAAASTWNQAGANWTYSCPAVTRPPAPEAAGPNGTARTPSAGVSRPARCSRLPAPGAVVRRAAARSSWKSTWSSTLPGTGPPRPPESAPTSRASRSTSSVTRWASATRREPVRGGDVPNLYSGGQVMRTLSGDDLAGMLAVYGAAIAGPVDPPHLAQPQERGSFRIVAPMISRN